MNIFGLIGMVEGIAGPGAFESALDAADDVVEALIVFGDQTAGRSGRRVPRGAPAHAVAVHSATPPRARFCCRRVCRRVS